MMPFTAWSAGGFWGSVYNPSSKVDTSMTSEVTDGRVPRIATGRSTRRSPRRLVWGAGQPDGAVAWFRSAPGP